MWRCYGALVSSSRWGHCWPMSFDNAKIRNIKWPLRRFYAIRGFLYVSMRFYTLGTLTRISLHTDLTDHTDFLHKLFLNTNKRIKRIFLNTDLTDHTDLLHEIFLNTNIPNNTNIICMRISFFLTHTDLTDLTDLPMPRMAHGCPF